MWIALASAWILGSVILYTVLVKTAKEPNHDECFNCKKSDCSNCEYNNKAAQENKRAA